jgi:sulfur-carrier protein
VIRVILPTHLRGLANITREVELDLKGPTSMADVMDELEQRYPMLRGTIRDHKTKERRAFIRFFACGEDLSHIPLEALLPEAVIGGEEPFRIVGAMAGG